MGRNRKDPVGPRLDQPEAAQVGQERLELPRLPPGVTGELNGRGGTVLDRSA
ncbi:MAG TPA: hypothetical protein VGD29_04915 [Actinoplanes sp.]